MAHHSMPRPPRGLNVEAMTVPQVVDRLRAVDWRRADHWLGIAVKRTPSGRLSIAGPKEVGYAVADALDNPSSKEYEKVRGRVVAQQ